MREPTGPLAPERSRLERAETLRDAARALRRRELEMVVSAGLGHVGGDLSAADIVATLVLGVIRVDPTRPRAADRDRFVLSKGHCSAVLYAALAARGFIEEELLDSFTAPLSALNGHPDAKKVPGVEANTGPLGHGLPVATGMAIAARLAGSPSRTFCLVGDGELQEGSNWEAMMVAGHRKLDRLTVVVDRNGFQQGAATEATSRLEPLAARAAAFGWAVTELDGHDCLALLECFESLPIRPGAPNFVIAHTHKGHPISFMCDRPEWHHRVPSAEELDRALQELADAP